MVSGDVEYDTEKEQLFVTFKNGSRYRYDNVSLSLYNAFKAHESTGKAIKELLSECPYQKVS